LTVKIEEIVEEAVELPELPRKVAELPKKKPKERARLSRTGVLELVTAMKNLLDQDHGVIEAFVLSEAAGLPVLLVGPHGSGKTTMVKALYSSLTLGDKPLQWRYVNVKEGQTEYMVFARPHFGKLVQGVEEWVPLAVGCDAVFIDEVFRNTRIFAALNEALEEGTFEGLLVKWKFISAATNPPNQYYRTVELLNYADLDRFAVIIEVEDRGLAFADKLAESFTPDTGIKVDASNLEKVRDEIRSTRVSGKALLLAKLMVAAFSVCSFEPVSGGGRPPTIYNKFAVIEDLKCYRCVYQKHSICPRYALAPKRAIRSLIALAKARAWVLGREVEEGDVAWAFRFTVPGRTAVISNELKELLPTYGALYERMMDDFSRWYEDNKAYLDPKAALAR